MSASEMGCGKEETGKEDMQEETASDVNMNIEETRVEGKDSTFSLPENNNRDQNAGENIDLQTENNDVKSLGLPTENHCSVDNQTPADDASISPNVDPLHGNNKDVELESVDNNDKGHESSANVKTNNNDSVDVNANELSGSKNDGSLVVEYDNASVDVNANELTGSKDDGRLVVESAAAKTDNNASVDVNVNVLSGSKNDGSIVNSLNQLERVAANERLPEVKAENYEKGENLDDASAVDVSASELSGRKIAGSHVHLLNQLEGAAADERPSEIKAENDEKGEKLDDASLVEVSANELSGNGSRAHTLNQLEGPAADERSSEMKAENDEEGEKLDDTSLLDVTSTKLSGSEIDGSHAHLLNQLDHAAVDEESSDIKAEDDEKGEELNDGVADMELSLESDIKESKPEVDVDCDVNMKSSNLSFLYEPPVAEGDESGTEEEQAAFVKEVENFYKERSLEFKHPKFYKEDLNLLKLWRAVIKLSGYEEVTSCKLWRQVGESFNPPKTCTTVSWTFRIFYEKALLEYEKHRMNNGKRPFRDVSLPEPSRTDSQASGCQALGSGRARRDAAARAMQGWHSKRLLGSGEVCQPIIKEKNSSCTPKSDRQIKNIGMLKRKKPSSAERTIQVANIKATNPQSDTMVIDVGPPADWVKINVQRTSDCFEVYALVPGLLREEVHVQSDPAGRLVISGQPEQLDNPWGVTPFKKVVSLPSRIDPHQTSAVVTLHGQLFVRVPFEQSDL